MALFGSSEPQIPSPDPRLKTWINETLPRIDKEDLRRLVHKLLGPHNRLHSPDAMAKAERIIYDDLQQTDWAVEKHDFSFANAHGALDYGDGEPAFYQELKGTNVIATKPGTNRKDAIVVLAHYDTRRDTPGADDNAASVAALLELARVLQTQDFQRTIVLAATDMEEILFFGARALVERLRKYNIAGVINFETMSFTSHKAHTQRPETSFGPLYKEQIKRMAIHEWAGDFTMIIYRGASSSLATALAAGLKLTAGPEVPLLFRDPGDLPLLGIILQRTTPFVRNFSRSDHVPFWEAGIPAIQITDTANFRNPHYHQPSDLPETLDYDRLVAIIGATAYSLGMTAGLK